MYVRRYVGALRPNCKSFSRNWRRSCRLQQYIEKLDEIELTFELWFVFQNWLNKWAIPGPFLIYFGLFQTNINTILQQINVKNVHPVYGTGIRTHDLKNMSLHP